MFRFIYLCFAIWTWKSILIHFNYNDIQIFVSKYLTFNGGQDGIQSNLKILFGIQVHYNNLQLVLFPRYVLSSNHVSILGILPKILQSFISNIWNQLNVENHYNSFSIPNYPIRVTTKLLLLSVYVVLLYHFFMQISKLYFFDCLQMFLLMCIHV